ncbi:MAG TPA: retropepsin-like aspartic protease [Lacipirellulaceae bacterium]|nr:retropepsin-like aspartic protease [Lacipirellulaceae bacterium]
MLYRCARIARACLFVGSIVSVATRTWATGVPIDGFLPMVGITLTDQFVEDVDFSPYAATSLGGSVLSATTTPYYDVALLDTGAAISLLTAGADAAFDLAGPYPGEPDGYRGTEFIQIGGATGLLDARVSDPLGLYAAGLQARSGAGASLSMNPTALLGQTNTSVATLPAESPLPNILGLSFASQYATRIRNSLPQVFELGGKTVRTPAVDFQPLGTGHTLGIPRKAPMSIQGSSPSTPIYQLNFLSVLNGDDSWENPSAPTLVQGGHFLNVNASNNGNALGTQQFFFDTGASVTVLSELTALQLGIDVQLDEPDFTIEVIGSGGGSGAVPGYYLDQFTVLATGGNLTLTNIPVLVFDVTNPASPGNVVPGIVGTNVFAGRDIVIDPNPSLGGGGNSAGVYISDPVTTDANWLNASASQPWFGSGQNWSGGALPGSLNVVNVRHIAGAAQRVILSVSSQVWEVNVSGASANQTMELSVRGVAGGATLTTFAGLNIEQFGSVELNGSSIDVQYVDIRDGGRLRGTGSIATGSGPIAGQVENSSGIVSPDQLSYAGVAFGAINIAGRYSNGALGVLEMELGGTNLSQYDRLLVDGTAALAGTLRILLSGGYVPSLGAQFTLLTTTAGLSGQFDATELPALAADRMWFVGYGADSLLLKVTHPGDFDGNGSVNGADLAVWKTGYGAKYTGADFVLWQRHLGAGASATAVPEPALAVLLCAAAAGLKRRRRQ